jgi:hypothetical protein
MDFLPKSKFSALYLSNLTRTAHIFWKLCVLASYDSADHHGQGIQISSKVALWLRWIKFFQKRLNLTVSGLVVTHESLPLSVRLWEAYSNIL